jgi:MFS family permease
MIGSVTGMQIGARLIDVIFRRLKRKSINQEAIPEFRVPLMFVSTFLLAAGLLIYGWSAQARLHWIVPNVGAAIFAMGVSINMACLQTYTIDAYPVYAASAIGATAVARALTGFTFPLFAPSMYERLGWGWGNSALALLVLIIGYPGATILWLFGGRLRAASPYAANS